MFYVEVVMEPTGTITDVKIAHQDDPVVNIYLAILCWNNKISIVAI